VSQELREKALDAAVRLGGTAEAVVKAAGALYLFLNPVGNSVDVTYSPKAGKAEAKPKAAVAEKPATKPSVVAPKKDEINPELKKMVGDKVNELLKADLREQAIALLATYEGATSATGIVKQGQEVVESFMAGADALLENAAGGMAD
jgi:hypothetical protein